jgi:hypothetical protein
VATWHGLVNTLPWKTAKEVDAFCAVTERLALRAGHQSKAAEYLLRFKELVLNAGRYASGLLKEPPSVAELNDTLQMARGYVELLKPKPSVAESADSTAKNVGKDAPRRALTELNETEKQIIRLVRKKALKGETIANKLGLSSTYIRQPLAKLVRRGFLVNGAEGYRASPKPR